ncbi:MAG TPA: acyl-CoA thioesterase [Steroidobacteraceae bacterium]|nr:acyl-CoA thioesterase [Steroidobacteraceae bacterium]
MRHFEYRLHVGFQETNVVGNVYFANYFLWQGKCREDFIRHYAPGVLTEFKRGYGMITRESACVFHEEAFAFDGILIRMGLDQLMRTGIVMTFDYYRERENGDDEGELKLLARGRQTALWTDPNHCVSLLPDYLYEAIQSFVRD